MIEKKKESGALHFLTDRSNIVWWWHQEYCFFLAVWHLYIYFSFKCVRAQNKLSFLVSGMRTKSSCMLLLRLIFSFWWIESIVKKKKNKVFIFCIILTNCDMNIKDYDIQFLIFEIHFSYSNIKMNMEIFSFTY